MLKILVNVTEIVLETTPYSEYNVSVAAKPADYGIWSQSVFTSFKTPAAGTVVLYFEFLNCFCLAMSHIHTYIHSLLPHDARNASAVLLS